MCVCVCVCVCGIKVMAAQHWEEMTSRDPYHTKGRQSKTGKKWLDLEHDWPLVRAYHLLLPLPSPWLHPVFAAFYPTAELWKDYWACFQICMEAKSILIESQPKVFLPNKSKTTFKFVSTLAAQMATWKEIEIELWLYHSMCAFMYGISWVSTHTVCAHIVGIHSILTDIFCQLERTSADASLVFGKANWTQVLAFVCCCNT